MSVVKQEVELPHFVFIRQVYCSTDIGKCQGERAGFSLHFARCYVAFHFGLKSVRVIYCTFYGELCGASFAGFVAQRACYRVILSTPP